MFLVALGLAGLLFGVGSSEVRKFENAAAKDISSRLQGDAKQVKVRTKLDPFQAIGGRLKSGTITASQFSTDGLPFFTQPDGSKRGRLDELKIQLSDFELTGLKVKRLESRIPDCRFDFGLAQKKGQIRLTKSGIGTGSVELEQEALKEFVLKRFPTISKLSVNLEKGQATFNGTGRFVAFQADFKLVGQLVSLDGNTIVLKDAKVFVGDQEGNAIVTKAILDLLNPVLDLDKDLKLHGAIRIQNLELGKGTLKATGVAMVPDQPATVPEKPLPPSLAFLNPIDIAAKVAAIGLADHRTPRSPSL